MPELYDQSARKRRKGGRTGPSSQPVAAEPTFEPTTDLPKPYSRVGTVERESHGTLPTGLAWALSQIPDDEKRLKRAVRLIAREVDVPWHFLFDKSPDAYIDPITGQKGLSAATIMRTTNRFAPLAIASMLQQQSAGVVGEVARREGPSGVAPVDVVKVSKLAQALTNSLEGPDKDFRVVIATAATLARQQGVKPKDFAQNLAAIDKWIIDTSRGSEFDWNARVWFALQASQSKRKLETNLDVVRFLAGGTVEEAITNAEVRAKVQAQIDAGTFQGLGTLSEEEQQALKAPADVREIAPQAMKMATSREAKDFFAQAKELETEIRLERSAFQRSFLGKALEKVSAPFNYISEKAQEGMIEAAGAVILGFRAAGNALSPDRDLHEAYKFYQDYRHKWHGRLNNGTWLGSQAAEDVGAPAWVGVGLDFAIGWYTDPTVIGGKVLKGLRSARVAPGLLEPSVTIRTILRPGERIARFRGQEALDRYLLNQTHAQALKWNNFYDTAAAFSKSRDSHKLLQMAMGEAGGIRRYLARIDELRLNYSASHPMSSAYMKALRDKIRERFPGRAWNDPEVIVEWEEGVAGAFGLRPTVGSVGDDAGKLLAGEQTTLRQKLMDELGEVAPGMGDEAREAIEAIATDPFMLPMSLEVPQFRFLGGLPGPRRLLRRAATSDVVQATSIGKRVSRLGVYHPPRWLSYHDNPERTAYEMSRYFRQSEKQARIWESKVLEARNGGAGFEDRIDEVMNELMEQGIRDIADPYNIDAITLDGFIDATLNPIRDSQAKLTAFAVDEGEAITRPLFESQRRNFSFLIDPIQVETRIQQLVGAEKRVQQLFFRTLDKMGLAKVPELKVDLARLQSRTVRLQERARQAARAYLRLWKATTVARPAYWMRVILLDEQARFLATTNSFVEYMDAFRSVGRALEPVAKRQITIGDDVIEMALPSRYAYEPMASNAAMEAEVLNQVATKAASDYTALAKGPGWGVVEALRNPDLHIASWERALVRDIANSPHGRLALESITEGKNMLETADVLKAYAREPANFVRLQRNGIISGVDDIDQWARQVAQVSHGYTLVGAKAQKSIAAAALAQSDGLGDILKAVPLKERPPVHGPLVDDLMLGNLGNSFQQALIDKLYGIFVRLPEDIVNRQRYYRIWKARAENAYIGHLEQVYAKNPEKLRQIREGIEAKAWPVAARGEFIETSDQLEAIFRAKSDKYWYHQTKADPSDLATTGLEPRFRFEADGTVRPWEGGAREARLYFAPAPEFSTYLTNQHAGPMLRVPKSAVSDVKPGMFTIEGTAALDNAGNVRGGLIPAEYISKSKVAAKDIEFFGTDGNWHPLTEAAKTVRVPHPFQQAVNTASRQFALDQVKKVMFDYTRQSRFSELLQIAFPFPQPFFEGFQAWGHIAIRNPEVIGRARALFKLGRDTGFIFQDENGEWAVKMGLYAKVARHLYLWDQGLGDTLSFSAPLDSFNMLSQSSIRLPEDGIIGRIAGGAYVPVPGLHAPLMRQLQYWFRDSAEETSAGYLFAYGPVTPLIPKPIRVVLDNVRRAFGDKPDISEERINAVAGEIMKQYQAQGLAVDADGNPLSEQEVADLAREQAIDLIMSQDLVSLLSPGALRARFGHDDVEDEFNRRAEEDGVTAAYDWLSANHPDLSLIGIGKTYFTGAYKDSEGKPVTAGRPPSSEFFARLVAQPRFRTFARNHPEWVALLAVGIGADVSQDFDIATYGRQIRAGVLSYKRPEDYWAQGEDAKAWQQWYTWRRDHWVPTLESLPEAVDEDDPAYTALRQQRREFLTHVATQHPGWARRHLVQAQDGTWDFGYDPDQGPASVIEVLADARAIVNTKGFEDFPGVQALRTYLDGRDDIEERMRRQGVRSVYDSAQLEREYTRLKKTAVQMVPEADQSTMENFLDDYFRGDLTNIRSYQDRTLTGKAMDEVLYTKRDPRRDLEVVVTLRDAVIDYDTQIEVLSSKALTGFEHNWERSQRYQDVRDYQETIWRTQPKVVKAWWRTLKPGEREEYKESLVTRPAVFWSSHDWEVMGIKVSKQASVWLNNMAQARIEIQRRENEDPTFSESDGYEAIDREIRALKGKDKSFDAVVKAMSDLAFPLEAAGFHKHPGRAGEAWQHIIDNVRQVQEVADRNGWMGVDFGKEEVRKYYALVQDEFIKYVKAWQDYSPAFKEEWNTLKSALGGSLIEDWLIPDNYFGRLGEVDE